MQNYLISFFLKQLLCIWKLFCLATVFYFSKVTESDFFYLVKNGGRPENVQVFCGQNGHSISEEAEYLLHMTYK